MTRNFYYYGGNSYFQDLLPYLQRKFPKYKFIEAFDLDLEVSSWVLLIPTIDNSLNHFIATKLDKRFKTIGLLDWNHFAFGDFKVFEEFNPDILLTPKQVAVLSKQIIIKSAHGSMMKDTIALSPDINKSDIFFCSQPLKEDRPELSFNQYDLMREAIEIAHKKNLLIYLKRHPREIDPLPQDISGHSSVKIWNGTIEEALSLFKIWYGLNSIALYDAQTLGHSVTFLRD